MLFKFEKKYFKIVAANFPFVTIIDKNFVTIKANNFFG